MRVKQEPVRLNPDPKVKSYNPREQSFFFARQQFDGAGNTSFSEPLPHHVDFNLDNPLAFKAAIAYPDTYTYQQAMADEVKRPKWIEAAKKEISGLEELEA